MYERKTASSCRAFFLRCWKNVHVIFCRKKNICLYSCLSLLSVSLYLSHSHMQKILAIGFKTRQKLLPLFRELSSKEKKHYLSAHRKMYVCVYVCLWKRERERKLSLKVSLNFILTGQKCCLPWESTCQRERRNTTSVDKKKTVCVCGHMDMYVWHCVGLSLPAMRKRSLLAKINVSPLSHACKMSSFLSVNAGHWKTNSTYQRVE